MAQKTVVEITCDLPEPGKPAEKRQHTGKEIKTLRFSLDGTDYEMEVCPPHEMGLRTVISEFAAHARRASTATQGRGRRVRPASTRERSAAIRAWARAERPDLQVSERGRIPTGVEREYDLRNSASALAAVADTEPEPVSAGVASQAEVSPNGSAAPVRTRRPRRAKTDLPQREPGASGR